MRRFLTAPLIALALLISATGAYASVALAQTAADAATNAAIDSAQAQQADAAARAAMEAGETQDNAEWAARTIGPEPNKTVTEPKETKDEAFGYVMTKIMSLFAWLLGVAIITLDYAVYYTVVTMGDFVKDLSAVGITWRILRDIGNIMLIFGFLAVGITTILNVDWYGGGKKMLPMLLISAVFLNFSLFISEAVIDTGNLFATQFYTQIKGGSIPSSPSVSQEAIETEGISNKIMGQLGLQTIYTAGRVNTEVFKAGNTWLIGFMGILLFMTAAFVMFSLAFILIARFVILIFLIILAPIGFAGLAVPKLSSTASKWWSTLFEQTITAPVLFLMLYIALAIITDVSFLSGICSSSSGTTCSKDWTGFVNNNDLSGFSSMLLSFLVAMGLLLAVTVFAKKLSAFGAGMATKVAGALSFGAVSLGGRATLGMTGNLLANKRMQSWARSSSGKWGSQYLARAGVFAGKGLRSSTYDVRNMPGATAGLGALGIDAGKGATITAKQAHDAQYGVKPIKEYFKHSAEEREQAGREIDFKDAQADFAAGRITRAAYDSIVAPVLSKMSTKQLEELGGIKKGVDALVDNLSPQQFESLMKSDKLSEAEKDKIKEARYRTLSNAVATGNIPDIKKAINSFSKGELEAMPADLLTHQNPATGQRLILEQLSDKQRETIIESKERTAAEKDLVRKSSPGGSVEDIFNTAGGGAAGAAAVAWSPNFARLTVPQLAKLHKDILLQPAVAEKLTTATLIELQEQKKLTPAEMIAIGNHIRGSVIANQKTKDYVTTGPGAALWA